MSIKTTEDKGGNRSGGGQKVPAFAQLSLKEYKDDTTLCYPLQIRWSITNHLLCAGVVHIHTSS